MLSAPPVLEAAEHALDQVTAPVGDAVEWIRSFARSGRGDHRLDLALLEPGSEGIGVVGLVGEQPFERGEHKGAKKGILPAFIEPELAALSDTAPSGSNWIHEIKFDGYRLQARFDGTKVQLLTRKGLDWTENFRAVSDALKRVRERRHDDHPRTPGDA